MVIAEKITDYAARRFGITGINRIERLPVRRVGARFKRDLGEFDWRGVSYQTAEPEKHLRLGLDSLRGFIRQQGLAVVETNTSVPVVSPALQERGKTPFAADVPFASINILLA